MMLDGVLLDTSFFLRFLNERDPNFSIADSYFANLLHNKVPLYISTIAISEYCVKGSMDQLPMRNLRVLPFNVPHAQQAGKFFGMIHKDRILRSLPNSRLLIKEDTKLFAQADTESGISHYITFDSDSKQAYDVLKSQTALHFQFIDAHNPYGEVFGELDFPVL